MAKLLYIHMLGYVSMSFIYLLISFVYYYNYFFVCFEEAMSYIRSFYGYL